MVIEFIYFVTSLWRRYNFIHYCYKYEVCKKVWLTQFIYFVMRRYILKWFIHYYATYFDPLWLYLPLACIIKHSGAPLACFRFQTAGNLINYELWTLYMHVLSEYITWVTTHYLHTTPYLCRTSQFVALKCFFISSNPWYIVNSCNN